MDSVKNLKYHRMIIYIISSSLFQMQNNSKQYVECNTVRACKKTDTEKKTHAGKHLIDL